MPEAHQRFRGTAKGAILPLAAALTLALVVSACSSSSNSNDTSSVTTSAPGTTSASNPQTSAATDTATSGGTGETTTGESSPASSPAGPTTGSGNLTIAASADPGNLDPSMTVLSVTRMASQLAYDTLVRQAADGSFISGLADSWKVTDAGVTFTLHPNVKCSDGSTLTATDVKNNIDFATNPDSKSPLTGTTVPAGLTTTADDAAGTVSITTPTPNAFLLNQLTMLFIVCKAGLADHAKLAQATIGTGPFVLTEAVPNDHYTYTLNPNYDWAPGGGPMTGPGIPATVTLRIIANQSTTANLLLSGEVNMAQVTGADVDRLTSAGLKTLDLRAPLGETFFNQDAGRPGADPQVRLALTTGSDMAQLMKVATNGKGTASTGLVTIEPKPCGQDTVTGNLPAYDPDKAKQILDADGWVAGPDGIRAKDGKKLTIKFLYLQSLGDGVAAAAELLGQEWQALGVDIKPTAITDTQVNDLLFSTGDWDAGWITVGVGLPSLLAGFVSGPAPATNFAHLNNATYNKDSVKAAATGDLTASCALWNSAETALIKDNDVVPMFDSVVSTYLKNATAEISGGDLVGSSLRLTS